jgi:hypothetical protein
MLTPMNDALADELTVSVKRLPGAHDCRRGRRTDLQRWLLAHRQR